MRDAANDDWLETNENQRDSFSFHILNRTCLSMRIVLKLWKGNERFDNDLTSYQDSFL